MYRLLILTLLILSCDTELSIKDDIPSMKKAYGLYSGSKFTDAIVEFDILINSTDGKEKAEAYVGKAFSELRLGNINRAYRDFASANTLDKTNQDALFGFTLLRYISENRSADTYLDELEELNPNYVFKYESKTTIEDLYIAKIYYYSNGTRFEDIYNVITQDLKRTLDFAVTDPDLPFKLLPIIDQLIRTYSE